MTAWDPPPAAGAGVAASASLTVDPFTSLAVNYGMLLGVSDFQVMGANPRGRRQLHQAWQHGKGVVWGFTVAVSKDRQKLEVGPGLAVDGLGREIASPVTMCLDVHQWLEEVMAAGFEPRGAKPRYYLDARLFLSHAACLSRPVPSVSSTCGEGEDSVQYSRVLEFGHLELRPYLRPVEDCVPKDDARDTWVDDRDDTFAAVRALVREGQVPSLPRTPEGWLDAFRSVAAQSASRIGPPGVVHDEERTRLFPEDEPGEVLLADLTGVVVEQEADGTWHVAVDLIDLSVRRTHLPTWVIEELVVEALASRSGPGPTSDAGGPRVARMVPDDHGVTIELTADVVAGTVTEAIEVRSLDRSASAPAWSDPLPVATVFAREEATSAAEIRVAIPGVPSPDITYRILLRGTGTHPLVGMVAGRPVPLAGWVGGPGATVHDGQDVVEMLRLGAPQ